MRDLAIDFLACGLIPDKATFWRQSDVVEVTELAWILSFVTPMGLLERCVSYKDKIAQGISPSHGLFAYPVLQAPTSSSSTRTWSGGPRPEAAPRGDARHRAEVQRPLRDGLLVIPEPRIREETAVVPGLDGRKMSKSYDNAIDLFEETEKKLAARRS